MDEEFHDDIVGCMWGVNEKYQWYYCEHMNEESECGILFMKNIMDEKYDEWGI